MTTLADTGNLSVPGLPVFSTSCPGPGHCSVGKGANFVVLFVNWWFTYMVKYFLNFGKYLIFNSTKISEEEPK